MNSTLCCEERTGRCNEKRFGCREVVDKSVTGSICWFLGNWWPEVLSAVKKTETKLVILRQRSMSVQIPSFCELEVKLYLSVAEVGQNAVELAERKKISISENTFIISVLKLTTVNAGRFGSLAS